MPGTTKIRPSAGINVGVRTSIILEGSVAVLLCNSAKNSCLDASARDANVSDIGTFSSLASRIEVTKVLILSHRWVPYYQNCRAPH